MPTVRLEGYEMNCPACNKLFLCPCGSCQMADPAIIRPNFMSNDLIACGYCGKTMHKDEWENEASKQRNHEAQA